MILCIEFRENCRATTDYHFIWVLCPRTLSHMSQTLFNSIVKTSNVKKFTQYTELRETQFLGKKTCDGHYHSLNDPIFQGREVNSFKIYHESIYNNRVIFLGQLSVNHRSTCIWNVISLTARLKWASRLSETPWQGIRWKRMNLIYAIV